MTSLTKNCHIKIWMNDTNAVLTNISECSSCYISENEDFNAILKIHVNNTFIGFFYAPTESISAANMEYIVPNGSTGKAMAWENRGGFFGIRKENGHLM